MCAVAVAADAACDVELLMCAVAVAAVYADNWKTKNKNTILFN